MDLNQINALPNTAKEKYMTLERLFETPGYKYLVEWAKGNVQEAIQRALNAPSWESFCFARGQQLAFENFTKLEEITEAEFSMIANDIMEQKAAEEELERSGLDE
jgi:hypothetical protein